MKCFPAVFYFNTSHVYINHPLQSLDCTWYHYFNTSHVYINRHIEKYAGSWKLISIHLMFILIYTWQLGEITSKISIHLMFILISYVRRCRRRWESISIHLMFILILNRLQLGLNSTHFNTSHVYINLLCNIKPSVSCDRFQYISCLY